MKAWDRASLGFSSACLAGKTLADAAQIGLTMGFRTYEMLAFDGYCHSQGELRGFYFEHMTPAERDALRQIADQFDHVSTHAPFMDMATVSPNPSVRATAQEQLRIAVEAVAFLGGETTTTHVVPKQIHALADFRREIVDLYRWVGDIAGELGVTVTLETGYPVGLEEFAGLVHGIGHPAVGANVDVGHLRGLIPARLHGAEEGAARYNDVLEAHIRSLAGKLYHFHLHDIRLDDFRDHRGAGRGFLDYERIFRVAGEVGYEGLFVFELEEPDLERALAESRAFVEAAMARAEGQGPV